MDIIIEVFMVMMMGVLVLLGMCIFVVFLLMVGVATATALYIGGSALFAIVGCAVAYGIKA